MKKFVCMAMAAMLTMGAVPAYGMDIALKDVSHTFTAKVGTTEFKKDGEAQPLDVAVYLKDGYTMLPLRTFMTAALEGTSIRWEKDLAYVFWGRQILAFDMKGNRILVDGTELPVSGKMEVKDGRVFIPLRNWGNILNACGFTVGEDDIIWDSASRTATVHVAVPTAEITDETEKPDFVGTGEMAEYSMKMTTAYDHMESLGNGLFLAQKFDIAITKPGLMPSDNGTVRYLLDAEGNILQTYDTGTDRVMRDAGEEAFKVCRVGNVDTYYGTVDYEGNTVIPFEYSRVNSYAEGLAQVVKRVEENGIARRKIGYADSTGEIVIPIQFDDAADFSEGMAAVSIAKKLPNDDGVDLRREFLYGYIDQTGKVVIDMNYLAAEPFSEGLAAVRTEEGYGFVDKNGKEVIPCQYKWVGKFIDGKTFAVEKDTDKTWVIDETGKKLKRIAEEYADYPKGDMQVNVVSEMKRVFLPGGRSEGVEIYYDTEGEISEEEFLLRERVSEGLVAYQNDNTEKYGYTDKDGKWIISPAFDWAEPFEDGYAIVANEITLENGTEDVEWGIIRHPNK